MLGAKKMNIEQHVEEAIQSGMVARLIERNGKRGVLFLDIDSTPGGEFIPFSDLNYNSDFGYFQLSIFPLARRDCIN